MILNMYFLNMNIILKKFWHHYIHISQITDVLHCSRDHEKNKKLSGRANQKITPHHTTLLLTKIKQLPQLFMYGLARESIVIAADQDNRSSE
jgi:hypothetical protein